MFQPIWILKNRAISINLKFKKRLNIFQKDYDAIKVVQLLSAVYQVSQVDVV